MQGAWAKLRTSGLEKLEGLLKQNCRSGFDAETATIPGGNRSGRALSWSNR